MEGLLRASKSSAFLASPSAAAALNGFAPFLRKQTEALGHTAVQGLAGAGTTPPPTPLPRPCLQETSPRKP